jgi:tetratricopeptide (TPR) repeat protein
MIRLSPRLYIASAALFPLFLLLGCNRETPISTQSPEALRYYLDGTSKWTKFYYNDAEEALRKALALDSSFALAWGRLALVYAWGENEQKAKEALQKAFQYAPHATQREQLYIELWNHRIRYEFADAARVADSLIALYPAEAEAYFFRGSMYDVDKRYDDALRMYRKSIEADTGFALAQMMLGYTYSTLGENDKALMEMKRYIRLAPDAADPRASYADLLMRVGRYEEALEQYQKALDLKPDYWYALRQTGEIFLGLGQLKKGEAFEDSALALMPATSMRTASRLSLDALVTLSRGRYAEAARKYREALGVDSTHWSAAFGIVTALGRLNEFEEGAEALEHIRRLLEMRNLSTSAVMLDFHVAQANLLTRQGDIDRALLCCDSALQYSSPLTRRWVYRTLAEIYLKQKNYEAALSACEEALKINPRLPLGLMTLTRVYAAMGDKVMTKEIGNRLLQLWKDADPDFISLRKLRQTLRGHLSPPA